MIILECLHEQRDYLFSKISVHLVTKNYICFFKPIWIFLFVVKFLRFCFVIDVCMYLQVFLPF